MAKKASASRRSGATHARRRADPDLARHAEPSLDAEDIAMDRLQAHLRRTETIQVPARPGAAMLVRTTVQLPGDMLQRLRDRARRTGLSISEVVEAALARYLKTP